MPKYKFQLANGKTMVLEGESQPSDADVEEAAKAQGVALVPVDAPTADEPAGPLSRFVTGVRKNLPDLSALVHPVTSAVSALAHPAQLASDIAGAYHGAVDASAQQFTKASDALGQGRYSEAAGHGLAAVLPGVGPAAANAGEKIGAGDIAGGAGEATGLLLPSAIGAVAPVVAPRAMAMGRNVAAGARELAATPLARNVAAGVVKHGSTATGATVGTVLGGAPGGVGGAIAGSTIGEELASRIRVPKAAPVAAAPTVADLSNEMGLNPTGPYIPPDMPAPVAAPAAPPVAAPAPLSPARQALEGFYKTDPQARIGGDGRMTMQGPPIAGGLNDVNKLTRYPMPKVDPFEAQLLKMEKGQPGFSYEGAGAARPGELPAPGLTVDAPTASGNAMVDELVGREAPAAKVPLKGNLPATKSRRGMSATPGLSVEDAKLLGINPDMTITGLTPNVIEKLLAERAARSTNYRNAAGATARKAGENRWADALDGGVTP